MFPTKSILGLTVLASLWVISACRPTAESKVEPVGIDFSDMTVEKREDLLSRLQEDLAQQNGSSVYNMGIVQKYGAVIEQTLGSLKGTSVLEIGPGRNLAVGVTLVCRGARKYSAVDIYEHPRLYDPSVYVALNRLAELADWPRYNFTKFDRVVKIEDGKVVLDPQWIEWLYPYESYNFPMAAGGVDFVFSHSGFEHFNEPRKTIERIFQVLRPGGTTAHSIDLRDHKDFSKPHAFLKLSAEDWRAQFTDENLWEYTNRWRAGDFRKAFEDVGFEVIEDSREQEVPVTEELKQTFHGDFQDYSLEELSDSSLWIVARKPDPSSGTEQPETLAN